MKEIAFAIDAGELRGTCRKESKQTLYFQRGRSTPATLPWIIYSVLPHVEAKNGRRGKLDQAMEAFMIVKRTLAAVLVLALCGVAHAEEIVVAAAISLKESLEAIRPAYEKESGDRLKLTFASSGQLASQIES